MHPGRGVPQGDGGDDGGYDDRATQRRLLPLRHYLQHQSGESKEILPTSSLAERALCFYAGLVEVRCFSLIRPMVLPNKILQYKRDIRVFYTWSQRICHKSGMALYLELSDGRQCKCMTCPLSSVW